MAEKHYLLNYKVLYNPVKNLKYIKSLYVKEEKKNYVFTIAYSDIGAFLTPLSVMVMQNNIKKYRKKIFDIVFNYCSVSKGLNNTTITHINNDIKTFIDFSNNNEFEIIIG